MEYTVRLKDWESGRTWTEDIDAQSKDAAVRVALMEHQEPHISARIQE